MGTSLAHPLLVGGARAVVCGPVQAYLLWLLATNNRKRFSGIFLREFFNEDARMYFLLNIPEVYIFFKQHPF